MYASETTTGSKVAEYGGNTHGFGSRSVLGKGWPTDLVKVLDHTHFTSNLYILYIFNVINRYVK